MKEKIKDITIKSKVLKEGHRESAFAMDDYRDQSFT